MFFLNNNKVAKPVVVNAIYKSRAVSNCYVAVCGVSKPDLKSNDAVNSLKLHDITFLNGLDLNLNIYQSSLSPSAIDLHHAKRDYSKQIVLYVSLNPFSGTKIKAEPLSCFNDKYEPVIGYTSENVPVTESDIVVLRQPNRSVEQPEMEKTES